VRSSLNTSLSLCGDREMVFYLLSSRLVDRWISK
jgi:hypothetical protein